MFSPSEKEELCQLWEFDSLNDSVAQGPLKPVAAVPDFRKLPSVGFEPALDHAADHVDCPGCRAANEALQAEKINLSSLPFSQARRFWMLRRAQSARLKPRTHEATNGYLDALGKFFGSLCLREITPGHLRAYQIARLGNVLRTAGVETHPWEHRAGHSIVNHELSALGQILRHCRLWHRIKPFYFPLPIPSWSPREILSEEDEERFFCAAAKHPEAQVAYWVAAITANTTAAGCELRGLRLRNVFLRDRGEISEIYVPEDAVKNDSRPRKIALNSTARWAIEQCYRRALELGSCEPEHYLFPFRIGPGHYDPARAPSRWWVRVSWSKLRKATGFPGLKPHDLRFLCITKMLERGVDPETVRAVAGHVTPKMMEYYAKHRRQAKYAAVLAIDKIRTAARSPKP